MRFLVKTYLSLEKLVLNPVAWFSHRNWLVRYAIILLLIPPLAIMSVVTYQSHQGTESSLTQISSETYQEVVRLRENFNLTTHDQAAEIALLKKEVGELRSQLTQNELIADDPKAVLSATSSANPTQNYLSIIKENEACSQQHIQA